MTLPAGYNQEPVNNLLENVAYLEQGGLILVCFWLVFAGVIGRFTKGKYEASTENAAGSSRIAFLLAFVAEGVPEMSAFVTHIQNYSKEPGKKKKWVETMAIIGYSPNKYVNRMLIN